MLAVGFDTLKLARKYESAGFQPKQAQDMAAALVDTVVEAGGNVVTKEDMQRLEEKLEGKIDNLEIRVGARISDTQAETVKWMIGIALVTIGTLAAIIFAVSKSGFPAH